MEVGPPVYEAFLAEAGDRGHSRMAYDGALLEIMSPSRKPEIYARLIDMFVHELAMAWGIEIVATGSVNLRAKPRGAEADASYYVGANAAYASDRDPLDPAPDPSPDIVGESDFSRERIDKTSIYADLGTPEPL